MFRKEPYSQTAFQGIIRGYQITLPLQFALASTIRNLAKLEVSRPLYHANAKRHSYRASALPDTLKAVRLQINGWASEQKAHALEQAKILDVCKDACCATLPNFPREYSV